MWEQNQKIDIENAFKYLNQIDSAYKNLSKYQENDQSQGNVYQI